MDFKTKKIFPFGVAAIVLLIVGCLSFYLFAPISRSSENVYLYIDNDDDIDSLSCKMKNECHSFGVSFMMTLTRHLYNKESLNTGRYLVTPSMGTLQLFRHIRNGQQEPMKLVVSSVRTKEKLAEELSEKLMVSKEELMTFFNSQESCSAYGLDTATIVCLFIPNTYEVYWNTSLKKLFDKMNKEQKAFWNDDRMKKADALQLSTVQVLTLASIIDEETANNGEKPMVAGMYYNRFKQDMPLQADPTVKFALQNFEIKRIYRNMLTVDSPYNTYKNKGLPPGPIRIPSVAGIDAVLNLVHHDYLYMCAKEDFSGTHNFAKTYSEHLKNAAKYSAALNARGIK